MIYSLLVLSSPATGHGARTAATFAHSLVARGHQLRRVFFLDQGVHNGATSVFPQDEHNPLQDWVRLAEQESVELVLCVSSALRRGLLDAEEAQRHEQPAATIHPAFTIGGLGQLVDVCASSDRLVSFGG